MITDFLRPLLTLGLTLFSFLWLSAYGGERDYVFKIVDASDGLPNNSIITMQEDTAGFIWIGTFDGLCRYDSRQLRLFPHDPENKRSISSNRIMSMLSDSKGRLWVGTVAGLNLYDPVTETFKLIGRTTESGTTRADNFIGHIMEDGEGNIWVGTRNSLFKLKKGIEKLERVPFSSKLPNSAIYQWIGRRTEKNGIWFARGKTLFNLKTPGDPTPETVSWSGLTEDDYIHSIGMDRQNNLWIGSRKGQLSRFDSQKRTFEVIPLGTEVSNISDISVGKDGILRVGTNNGLFVRDERSGKWTRLINEGRLDGALTDSHILTIFQDSHHIVWVGTYNSGVNCLFPGGRIFNQITGGNHPENLNHDIVSAVGMDGKQQLYVGTLGGGIDKINPVTRRITDIPNLNYKKANSISVEEDGSIWIGEDHGLRYYDAATGKTRFYAPDPNNGETSTWYQVYKIEKDKKGNIWMATDEGLVRFEIATGKYEASTSGIATKGSFTLLIDSKQNIWTGGVNEVILIENKTDTVRRIGIEGFSKNIEGNRDSIISIVEDSNGDIWIALFEKGILKYNKKTNRFERVTYTGTDLTRIGVQSMSADTEGRLWIASVKGLWLIDIAENKASLFGKYDGLNASEYIMNGVYKGSDGILYFGTNRGLFFFDPHRIDLNEKPPRVVFTGLEVNNKPVHADEPDGILTHALGYTRHLVLTHEQNFFKIGFATLNYLIPEKNKYAYRLEGSSQAWIYTDDPWVNFTNLAPGSYVLQVRGANNDNVWVEKPVDLRITVKPPAWASWWAYCLYFLVFATIAAVIARLLWLRASFTQRMELSQAKMDFFTNISHEIRTNLTLILGPVEHSLSLAGENKPIHKSLRIAKSNADRLLSLVTELLDFRKLENKELHLKVEKVEMVSFLKNILTVFGHLPEEKGISLGFDAQQEQIDAYIDPQQFDKVVFNLLSNATKFTDPGGKIVVRIAVVDQTVRIEVIDNGRGIAAEHLHKIFINYFQEYEFKNRNTGYGIGLALSKKIVELHHGNIKAESTRDENTGVVRTCFTIDIPVGSEHFKPEEIAGEGEADTYLVREKIEDEFYRKPEDSQTESLPLLLIADDNDELLFFLSHFLREKYRVITCSNGVEGLKEALDKLPDLIITDWMMPEMNGGEFCRRIKNDDQTSHIPVIMLTARADTNNIIEGLDSGADHYLIKPFSPEDLELRVRNLLRYRDSLRSKFRGAMDSREFGRVTAGERDEAFIQKLVKSIEQALSDESFGVDELAKDAGVSRAVLYKKVKAITDMSVNDFIKSVRISRAAELLRTESYNVSEVSEIVGFSDRRYFSREFRKVYQLTPSEYSRSLR